MHARGESKRAHYMALDLPLLCHDIDNRILKNSYESFEAKYTRRTIAKRVKNYAFTPWTFCSSRLFSFKPYLTSTFMLLGLVNLRFPRAAMVYKYVTYRILDRMQTWFVYIVSLYPGHRVVPDHRQAAYSYTASWPITLREPQGTGLEYDTCMSSRGKL